MADLGEKRETGGELMFAGLAVWVSALLVLFYLPAGVRLGHQGLFASILIGLGVIGSALMLRGWCLRGGESSE